MGGTQGPDISTIPAMALRQVEVLRDGASAQYGSDAIAGVMNFLLKDDPSGGSLEVKRGVYGAGDGQAYTIAGDIRLPLGENGFAHLSMEYGNADPTSRSVQRADAAALIAAGNTHVLDPAQVFADPNCFSFQEIAPGGFTPYFSGVMTDTSAVAGVRRTTKAGFTWDARSVRRADAPVLDGRYIFDLEVSIPLVRDTTLSVGGQNVFDTFSDRMDLFAARFGLPYSQFTPWGLGGYYYARLHYRWGR